MGSLRAYRVSPPAFRRLSWAAVASLFAIVTSGAVVRLTASGLGCDNWPRCGDTPFPAKDFHAIVEFGNRALGLVPITLSLLLWLAARRTPGLGAWVRRLAAAVFLGTIAQAPLGGLTVVLDLHPLLVMSHFLLAMLVLGGAVVVGMAALGFERGWAVETVAPPIRWTAVLIAAAALAVVVSGAFVTAAGPHSGGADIERLGSPLLAIRVHVRATAVFGLGFVALVAYLVAQRRRFAGILAIALGVLGIVLAQMAVGEIQYRTMLPWWLVLVHVALASALWAGCVVLAFTCFRVPQPVAAAFRRPDARAAAPGRRQIGAVS